VGEEAEEVVRGEAMAARAAAREAARAAAVKAAAAWGVARAEAAMAAGGKEEAKEV
jgi:hypothetical protein